MSRAHLSFLTRWIALSAMLGLSACTPSPEQARDKLKSKQVAVNEQSLLSTTKSTTTEDTAKLLVHAGVDVNARQPNGMTALMSAAFNGQHDTAKLLIAKGADVNATAKGFTALRLAVERNDLAMVKQLLAAGANPRLAPDGAPSALAKATEGGNRDLIELLEKAPAK